jgi:hypothetical protein
MSLEAKTKERSAVRLKLMGASAQATWAKTDEETKKMFDEILKLRAEYRALGGEFGKKKVRWAVMRMKGMSKKLSETFIRGLFVFILFCGAALFAGILLSPFDILDTALGSPLWMLIPTFVISMLIIGWFFENFKIDKMVKWFGDIMGRKGKSIKRPKQDKEKSEPLKEKSESKGNPKAEAGCSVWGDLNEFER